MWREVLSRTDTLMCFTKTKMATTLQSTRCNLQIIQRALLLPQIPYLVSMPSSVLSMAMQWPNQWVWSFGKHSLETLLMDVRLWLTSSSQVVRPSGMWRTVLLCFCLTVMMARVQSTLLAESKDICSWLTLATTRLQNPCALQNFKKKSTWECATQPAHPSTSIFLDLKSDVPSVSLWLLFHQRNSSNWDKLALTSRNSDRV